MTNEDTHKDIQSLEAHIAALQYELQVTRSRLAPEQVTSTGVQLEYIVQTIIDIGVQLVGAQFGAFFYTSTSYGGQRLMLYALAGAPREAFSRFPIPGRTSLFGPTFDGEPIIRSDDVLRDPRYGHTAPHYGMPPGHLPVRSYLAASVVSAEREALGGLFFGHPDPAVFNERSERIVKGIAQIAALALENSRLLRAVQNSERRFKGLIENSTEGIVVVDASEKLSYVSPATTAIEGYTPEELIGTNPMERVHPDDQPKLAETLERLLATPTERAVIQVRQRHKSGKWIWLEGVTTNLLDDPSVRGMVTNYRDVTDRKRAEEALIRSQKMEALGTLAGGIAHDFNNLLLAIAGNAKLAISDLDPDHPATQSIVEITKAGQRATDLVARILAFSRQQEPKREAVELPPIVDDALHLLRATLPAMISIKTHFDPDVPTIFADSSQVHQVIMNLMTNASHAIGQRAGTIEVTLEAVTVEPDVTTMRDLRAGRYAHLAISDDGSGMSSETIGRMFDPFFTTKPPGQGTGLGLSVVHGIVKAHDGAIGVYSQLDKGSTFHVYLPAANVSAANAQTAPHEVARGHGERVLYIDDDSAIVFLTGRILERLGYRVTGCETPESGLETFRARPDDFDVVVTDLSMPGMSGFDIARELSAIRPNLPILMTSGYVRPEDRETARARGIRDLILKPNSVEELGESLDRLFREIRATR